MKYVKYKINKKICCSVLLTIILLLVSFALSFIGQANAEEIVPYSDAESSIYGFNVDENNFDVKWTITTQSVNYNGAYCGDLTYYLGGVKMKNKLSNGNYCYGVLVYVVVTPREFTLTADGRSHTYRGRSRYIELQSGLSSNQTLLNSTPENIAGSSSYTVGLTASVGPSGPIGGITASTAITQNALSVFNYSNSQTGEYRIKYEYIRHLWPWEWQRTEYCWYQSVQRSAFFFSSPSTLTTKSITSKATFAIDDGAVGMWNLEMGYEVTGTRVMSVRF